MFKDKYLFIKILTALIIVAVVVAVLTNNIKEPLSADIVSGNTSADAIASDFLDWMMTADNNQIDSLAELSANILKLRTKSDGLDIASSRNAWELAVDKIVDSKPQVTFDVSTQKVLDQTIYKDYNGQPVSKEKYDQIRQGLQLKVEKELDKDKVIQRYERTVTPSDELVKRWDKMFDKVMEEADRRMPPIEYTYKNLMYVEYKLKDNTKIKVFIKQIGDRFYLDESMYPDSISINDNSTGD